MNELLPHYERELGFLRKYSREFAEHYPKIAGGLLMSGDVCEDPHIERMIQSFALLTSRVSKRLDDDYPQLTEALLEVLYPHYLRPFPSCSIVRMDYRSAASQLTSVSTIKRGTDLSTRPVKGVACKFRTVFDVTVAPIVFSSALFEPVLNAPASTDLPVSATSSISIGVMMTSSQDDIAQLGLKALRVFIDGEPSFCAALRDAIFMRSIAAYVEPTGSGAWHPLKKVPVAPVGYSEEEALIPFPKRSHPAYRLLTEYFAFSEKFNFFDLDFDLLAASLPSGCREFKVHLILRGLRADSDVARVLGSTSNNSLLLGCTPVINLFKQRGEPIRLTHAGASYPVLGDARRAFAFEVYAIETAKLVRQTPQGESITEFRPFYSLRHGEVPDKDGHYWLLRRDELVAENSPGYEAEISLVDIDFDPAKVETDTLSLELTCSNRDLPASLTYGLPGGDLFLEGGSVLSAISFLRKPTESLRFSRSGGTHWRLISQLSLNHLSLSQAGLESLQEILSLYDLPRSPISQRQIGSIVAIESRPTKAWLPGNPFACMVRGVEVRLTIEEEGFVGSGIHVFAQIMERFLGLYVHANSFTQLILISRKTGEELLRCMPQNGNLSLV